MGLLRTGKAELLKRSEEADLYNNTLLKVLDSLDAVVYVADMETYELLFVNQYIRDIFGDIEGKICWKTLQSNQSGPCDFCTNDKLVGVDGKPTGVYAWEFQNTINGRWYDIHDRAIPWADGRLVRLEIATDITPRKKAEEKLKEYAHNLEEANRFKDLFTDIISHDLINPAGVVRMVADEMIKQNPKNRDLQILKRNINKLLEIIENARSLSKLESITEVELAETDLRDLIEKLISQNNKLFESSNIRLENRLKTPMRVMANPVIEEVFQNIFSNAVRHASDGKKLIIESEGKEDNFRIRFIDHGPGIPDEYKETVFDRFIRKQKGGVKGSGLGLAIARKVLSLHNGRIWVEDNPLGGAVFIVEIAKL